MLGLAVSELLFENYPEESEGWLSKTKALVVSTEVLSRKALNIGLNEFVLLGKGEIKSGGKKRTSIMEDSFEAIIGALFLDGNYKICKKFISKQFQEEFQKVIKEELLDFKTVLQEFTQEKMKSLPVYELVEETGPEHEKTFHIAVKINNIQMGHGYGKSKKEAGQSAAKEALQKLKENSNGKETN